MFKRFFTRPWPYLVIIFIGISLKFYHLNHRIFWLDEVSTVLYTSGQNEKELINKTRNQIVNIKYYDSLLHPLSGKHSITSEVKQIFSNTHLTPAHYVFLAVWYRMAGDSATDFRLFSVLIYLLCLPFLFLLIKKLSGDNLHAWIATSLFSVSPFISFHAQEARYYILWVLVFILSNYVFLLTISKNKMIWWIAYSIISIVALYTTLLSGLIILGHLLYILFFHKEMRNRFFLSAIFIALAYSPWLYFLYSVKSEIRDGLSWQISKNSSFFTLKYLFYQLLGWSRSFNYLADSTYYLFLFWGIIPITDNELYPALIIDMLILCLILYAIKYFFANSQVSTRWLLVFLILPTFLLFYISDSIRSGFISAMWRYHVVNMVGIIIVVTYFLRDKIVKGRLIYIGCYVSLAVISIASIIKFQKSRTWFLPSETIIHLSKAIDQSSHPLVITDFDGDNRYGLPTFISMLTEVKSKSADILYYDGSADILKQTDTRRYSEILVLFASEELIQKFKTDYGERMSVFSEKTEGTPSKVWQIKR
jgi:uncharacterized membrane protein